VPDFRSHDGIRLHYEVVGDPALPPLLAVAGGPARHPRYLADLPGLTGLRSLLLLEQRGVGASDPSPTAEAATWPELAEDIEALRASLGLDRIDLLGHSAGTRVALSYAARYAARLASLCLVTPPATWLVDVPDDTAEIIGRHRDAPWFAGFHRDAAALGTTTDPVERARLFAAIMPIAWAHWNERAIAHEASAEGFPEAAARYNGATGVDTDALRERLGGVECPVLVLVGEEDGLTGVAPAVALAELFPHGRTVRIPDAGHYPWVENAADVARALSGFFAATLPPRNSG
jgi:proline iminopeptidase